MVSSPLQLRRSKRKQPSSDTTQHPEADKRPRQQPLPKQQKQYPEHELQVQQQQTPHDQSHNPNIFPFLALPRELRDEIYKHVVLQDRSTTLSRISSSRNLITRCGLVGVNSQICDEFLDAVLLYAPVITTTVRNHNFAHVVTFLNRLSEAQLARLSTRECESSANTSPRKKRRIRITLSYTAGGATNSRAHLNRWLDRFDDPDKRGKEIEFEYDNDGTYQNGGYKQRPKERASASQRWNGEARKIGIAAASGNRGWGGWSRGY